MTPVLIYTDTQRIAAEKAILNKVVTLFQAVYTAFKGISITVTIQEINNLVSWTLNDNGGPDFVANFALNKAVDSAGPLTIGGITLDRAKFIDLMSEKPNVTTVIQALGRTQDTFMGPGNIKGVRINVLSLTGDVISKVNDSDTQIEAEFTYYTKTDASAALCNSLQSACDGLNTHDEAYDNHIAGTLSTGNMSSDHQFATPMPGIAIAGEEFVPHLGFIRKFEQSGSLTS